MPTQPDPLAGLEIMDVHGSGRVFASCKHPEHGMVCGVGVNPAEAHADLRRVVDALAKAKPAPVVEDQ